MKIGQLKYSLGYFKLNSVSTHVLFRSGVGLVLFVLGGNSGEPAVKVAQLLIYGVSQQVLITAGGRRKRATIQTPPSLLRALLHLLLHLNYSRHGASQRPCPSNPLYSHKVTYTFPSRRKHLSFLVSSLFGLVSDPRVVPMGH